MDYINFELITTDIFRVNKNSKIEIIYKKTSENLLRFTPRLIKINRKKA